MEHNWHRQQLYNELQRKLREEYFAWPIVSRPCPLSSTTRYRGSSPSRPLKLDHVSSRSCRPRKRGQQVNIARFLPKRI
eukprot:623344-Pleurochrysis_carterae.AAC.11